MKFIQNALQFTNQILIKDYSAGYIYKDILITNNF